MLSPIKVCRYPEVLAFFKTSDLKEDRFLIFISTRIISLSKYNANIKALKWSFNISKFPIFFVFWCTTFFFRNNLFSEKLKSLWNLVFSDKIYVFAISLVRTKSQRNFCLCKQYLHRCYHIEFKTKQTKYTESQKAKKKKKKNRIVWKHRHL